MKEFEQKTAILNRFKDKIAIVTGGISGIGGAITQRLIDEGATVIAIDINPALVESVLSKFGDAVIGKVADVTNEEKFSAVLDEVIRDFGNFHLLINVAGGAKAGNILDMTLDDFEFALKLNLGATFLGTRLAARHFINSSYAGTIVNIASLNSFTPMFDNTSYAPSKAAAVMFTRQAALELAEHGIRVNAISPGLVRTKITEPFLNTPGVEEKFLERIPMKRIGKAEEIAATAAFLASDEASYITGDNIVVDGGWAQTGYPDLRELMP